MRLAASTALLVLTSTCATTRVTGQGSPSATKSITLAAPGRAFIGGPLPLVVRYTNRSPEPISFRDPTKTWELRLIAGSRELRFGQIGVVAEGAGPVSWVVEDADTITLRRDADHVFEYDVGRRWPEVLTIGRNPLQLEDQSEDPGARSNGVEVRVEFTADSIPALLDVLDSEASTPEAKAYANAWLARVYPAHASASGTRAWATANASSKEVARTIARLNQDAEMPTESIGRFRIAHPSTLPVVHRMQSIYGVDVWADAETKTSWPRRIAGKQLKSEPRLGPDIEVVWYQVGDDLLIDAHKGDIWAHRGAPDGKQPQAEELVRDVLLAYRPGVKNGFSIGPGAIVIETSLSETTRMQLKNETAEVELSTRTVREPDVKKFSGTADERDFASSAGGSVDVLRERTRTVAGMTGRELWIQITTPKTGTHTRFTWHFPGEAGSATRPSLTLLAKTSGSAAELERVWESMLPSIEMIPAE